MRNPNNFIFECEWPTRIRQNITPKFGLLFRLIVTTRIVRTNSADPLSGPYMVVLQTEFLNAAFISLAKDKLYSTHYCLKQASVISKFITSLEEMAFVP